ncbi:MAG: hypothetical protein DHS20C09_04170 [marine bacterium B5-7]|nr:MAG: hypothetical protein DHS20C09_04170 [marine bacterium B5-7]
MKLSREIKELNHHLHEAVNISPPHDLAARILLRQSLSKEKKSHFNYYISSGLAACLLLAISIIFITPNIQDTNLERAVISYANNNAQIHVSEQDIKSDELKKLFTSIDMNLDGNLGVVNYAMPCFIREQISLHLVVAGTKGPVTVLMMPEGKVNETMKIKNTNINGIIVPCPKGSMAILGTSGEDLDQIHTRFLNSINWDSV